MIKIYVKVDVGNVALLLRGLIEFLSTCAEFIA